jgi:hypothetical protein
MECGAVFDQYDFTVAKHRYVLWRVWESAKNPLVVIGLNPSTATHLLVDATVRRDIRYARDWGYGGLVKLNLFSYRSTDPRELYRWVKEHGDVDTDALTGGPAHSEYLKWFTDSTRAGLVLCAWGTHGTLLSRAKHVANMLSAAGVKLHALDVTKDGMPRHTLYMRADLKPKVYEWAA